MHIPSVINIFAWFSWMCHSNTQVRSQKAIAIGDVTVHIAGKTSQLKDHPSVASLGFERLCLPGEAFYSTVQSKLVNNGNYVKFEDLNGMVSTYTAI